MSWSLQIILPVCVCAGEGSVLELHPATSSPSSWQDYWHRIPLPLAEIARTQGQFTRIWELPWALLVCDSVSVLFVYLHGHPLYKWSRFPLRCWAAWLREEHYEFTALWLSLTHGSVSIISDVITLISKNLIWSLQMIYITGTAVASLTLHRTKSPERRFFFLNLIWNTTTFMGNFKLELFLKLGVTIMTLGSMKSILILC